MSIDMPSTGPFYVFVILVDINGFTNNVRQSRGFLIAQFTRDTLSGPIKVIEKQGGDVVGFMGDAILGVLPYVDSTVRACFGIAKNLNDVCEYISEHQRKHPEDWDYAQGGPSLKIAVECGTVDSSTIHSSFLGTHRLLIGNVINYAARIATAGTGNRCLIGPMAFEKGFSDFNPEGPLYIRGKPREGSYQYYRLDLGDIWVEGKRRKRNHSYLP